MYCKNCGMQMNDNQEVCLACGVATGKGNGYCQNCGKPVSPEAEFCMECGAKVHKHASENAAGVNPAAIKTIEKRDLIKAIIFSILTCGIYQIYWFIVLTDEVNRLSGHDKDMSGALSFVLCLVTCGIYGYIWAYFMGGKMDKITGATNTYTSILYLVLQLFGFEIVNLALMQDAINKAVDQQ